MSTLSDRLQQHKAERKSRKRGPELKLDRILDALDAQDREDLIGALAEPDPTFTEEFNYSSTDIALTLEELGHSISPTSVRRWRQRNTSKEHS